MDGRNGSLTATSSLDINEFTKEDPIARRSAYFGREDAVFFETFSQAELRMPMKNLVAHSSDIDLDGSRRPSKIA